MTAGLLAAQPGGWTGAPSGDGGAAVPDAWPPSGDAAFAGLLPGYAFAQSVTQTLSLTAADSITDTGALELRGASRHRHVRSGGSTYAAVAAVDDDGVQILNVTDPSAITAAGNITDTEGANELLLNGAYDIAIFESGGSTYAAVTAYIDNGVQILNITDPSAITAEGNIVDTYPRAGPRTGHRHVHIGRQHLRGGHLIHRSRRPDTQHNRPVCHHRRGQHHRHPRPLAEQPTWHRHVHIRRQHIRGGHRILQRRRPDTQRNRPVQRHRGRQHRQHRSLELHGAKGIAVFESGGSTYAAVAADSDDGVQILDITDPSAITAEGSIADTASLELRGARGIATFTSGGSTYAAVASSVDSGVQILDITDPSAVTAAGSITDADAATLELSEAESIATFTSGGSTYAAVAAYDDRRRPDPAPDRPPPRRRTRLSPRGRRLAPTRP